MPIDIETFERESEFQTAETHADRVIRFLPANADKAFEREEVAEGTGIDANTVSAVLSRLKQRELVRHKPPYWAIGDLERVRASMDLARDIERFDEQFGREDMDAWREAGSEKPHPSNRESGE
jgi:hypothetical protein